MAYLLSATVESDPPEFLIITPIEVDGNGVVQRWKQRISTTMCIAACCSHTVPLISPFSLVLKLSAARRAIHVWATRGLGVVPPISNFEYPLGVQLSTSILVDDILPVGWSPSSLS